VSVRPSPRRAVVPLLLMAGTLAAACASSGPTRSSGAPFGAVSSEAAVRGFLDAANAEDYQRMGELFGTERGPAVRELGIEDVEARMIVLSKLLRHEGYALRKANLAMLGPDRVRWEAALGGTRKGDVVVPVITVPAEDGRWFVERLNVDAVSGGL
jgi:hypothetical protein